MDSVGCKACNAPRQGIPWYRAGRVRAGRWACSTKVKGDMCSHLQYQTHGIICNLTVRQVNQTSDPGCSGFTIPRPPGHSTLWYEFQARCMSKPLFLFMSCHSQSLRQVAAWFLAFGLDCRLHCCPVSASHEPEHGLGIFGRSQIQLASLAGAEAPFSARAPGECRAAAVEHQLGLFQ